MEVVLTAGHLRGLIATVLAIMAFIISIKKRSYLVAGLLSAAGIISTIHLLSFLGDFNTIVFPGPIVGFIFSLMILGLGVAKDVGTVRAEQWIK
ncbi:MAG: hypothetical protein M3251_04130 [Thermoproteota archaeon]|nr:hypothetical protein [Thermoproteota archaeon]